MALRAHSLAALTAAALLAACAGCGSSATPLVTGTAQAAEPLIDGSSALSGSVLWTETIAKPSDSSNPAGQQMNDALAPSTVWWFVGDRFEPVPGLPDTIVRIENFDIRLGDDAARTRGDAMISADGSVYMVADEATAARQLTLENPVNRIALCNDEGFVYAIEKSGEFVRYDVSSNGIDGPGTGFSVSNRSVIAPSSERVVDVTNLGITDTMNPASFELVYLTADGVVWRQESDQAELQRVALISPGRSLASAQAKDRFAGTIPGDVYVLMEDGSAQIVGEYGSHEVIRAPRPLRAASDWYSLDVDGRVWTWDMHSSHPEDDFDVFDQASMVDGIDNAEAVLGRYVIDGEGTFWGPVWEENDRSYALQPLSFAEGLQLASSVSFTEPDHVAWAYLGAAHAYIGKTT